MIDIKFLGVADLNEQTYEIEQVCRHLSYGKMKECLKFENLSGFWPLSSANKNDLKTLFGEAENWPGKEIVLYKTTMEVNDRTIPCLKIKVPVRKFVYV